MRIGILTFHCAHNYGAVLQAYALQVTLKKMGHTVVIIDYRPNYLITPYKIFSGQRYVSKHPIKLLIKPLLELSTIPIRKKRYKAFDHFITSNLNLSNPVVGTDIPTGFDAYIMGSDQIWNPKITKGFDDIYFGYMPFTKNDKKYISYAASMEGSSLTNEQQSYYIKALQNFDAVSVRENNLTELLQPLTDKTVHTVLDPTLLADPSIWDSIVKAPSIKKKYVLIYQVRYNANTLRIAKEIATQLQAEVISLSSNIRWRRNNKTIQDASPKEFLGWIKHASCIVTTSFHGTVFSTIFQKPFYCIKLNDGNDNRSASLLQKIGLIDRMIDKESHPIFTEIDFKTSEIELNHLRMESTKFLKQHCN